MTVSTPFLDPIRVAANTRPDSPAVIHADGVITFADLHRLVSSVAEQMLKRFGGPRFGLCPQGTWKDIVIILACIRARRVACLFSTRWPDAAVENGARMLGGVPMLDPDDLIWDGSGGLPLNNLETVGEETPATVMFTTGSSGEPKAVQHSIGNHLFSAMGANAVVPLRVSDRWLLSLPLYHVGGLGVVFRCLCAGAAVVVPSKGIPVRSSIAAYGCTHASLVATQLRQLLAESARRASSHLRTIVVGGSSIPHALLLEARGRGFPVVTSYGLTEMSSQVTTLSPDEQGEKLKSSGRLLRHRELRVDASGEIHVRGQVLFQGYVQEGGLHLPLTDDGWFATGDMGRISKEGYLYVTGRKDRLFISGGENIVPEEIEQALREITYIDHAVVVPVKDDKWGERPVAFVAGTTDWGRIACLLESRLPKYKIPTFHPWPSTIPHEGIKVTHDVRLQLAASLTKLG